MFFMSGRCTLITSDFHAQGKIITHIWKNYKQNFKFMLFPACLYVHNFIVLPNVHHCTLTCIKNLLEEELHSEGCNTTNTVI